MFQLNEDLSIYATRGDIVFFTVSAEEDGEVYTFKAGDVVRIKIYGKKNAESIVLEKDFPVTEDTDEVEILLDKEDTKIGDVISKPKDYWYEVELNPFTNPQTIIGYDEDGAKVFRLFPEGADIPAFVPTPEDIPFVDDELDMTSTRPVQNQAIARAIVSLRATSDKTSTKTQDIAKEIEVERKRIDNLVADRTPVDDLEVADIRVGADGVTYASAGEAVREQILAITKAQCNPNLMNLTELHDGYIDAYGAATGGSSVHFCYYTDFIPVDPALPYYWHVEHPVYYGNDPWVGFSTYDADKNHIERLSWYVSDRAVEFNENVAFVRISFRSLMLGEPKFEQSTYATLIAEEKAENLAEIYPICVPGYVNPNGGVNTPTAEGYIGVDGLVMNEKMSRFVPVTEGDTYVFYNGVSSYPWSAVAFYGSDGLVISRATFTTDESGTFEVTAPSGAIAMRYCARTYSQHSFVCYKKTGHNDYMEDYLKLKIANHTYSGDGNYLVKSVAHRGFCSKAPENTLPAYKLAKANGFDYAECDISFTSDGVAVLLHDNTIDRTSNGTGNIADMTFEEVRKYDFGSWYGEQYAGTLIPAIGDFLYLCRSVCLKPYIELKAGTNEQVAYLVEIVKTYGLLDKTTWISFNADYLKVIKDVYSKARLGFVVSTVTDGVITTALSLRTGENEVFIDSNTYTDEEVRRCINADLPMEVWTVNDANTMLNLPVYVSGVTSDIHCAGKLMYENVMN